MNSTLQAQILELHRTFNHPVNEKPFLDDPKLTLLRIELLSEELKEFIIALQEHHAFPTIKNKCLVLDALCDMQVVLEGAFISMGFFRIKDIAMLETHRSNMSKLGPDGKPIVRADGKFLKGPNYSPPDYYSMVKNLMESQ